MTPQVRRIADHVEYPTAERCAIVEVSNSGDDPDLSIARARVAPGVTTAWHRLAGIAERYVVSAGRGRMELAGAASQEVGPGDVVLIPPGCAQRIANIGSEDLVFLALCTPRFRADRYEALESPQDMPATGGSR